MTEHYQPLAHVEFVPREKLTSNNYNPNVVDKEELDLLEQSIITNGWTMPIVVDEDYVIVDGFHRWKISDRPRIREQMNHTVPVVKVKYIDPDHKKYGTVTHNRARGAHLLKPMQKIVEDLINSGKSIEEIQKNLGMTEEEIYRLSARTKEDFLRLMLQEKTK